MLPPQVFWRWSIPGLSGIFVYFWSFWIVSKSWLPINLPRLGDAKKTSKTIQFKYKTIHVGIGLQFWIIDLQFNFFICLSVFLSRSPYFFLIFVTSVSLCFSLFWPIFLFIIYSFVFLSLYPLGTTASVANFSISHYFLHNVLQMLLKPHFWEEQKIEEIKRRKLNWHDVQFWDTI